MELTDLATIGGSVPFILALVQLCKNVVAEKWYPLLSVGFGLLIALGVGFWLGNATQGEWMQTVFVGFISGLTASGLYSGGKVMTQ